MNGLYGFVRRWLRSPRGRRLVRYTLVSLISTSLSIVVIGLVYGFRILDNEVVATLLGNVLAIVPSYQLNRRWTWGRTDSSHIRSEVVPFWFVSLMSIGFAVAGADLARRIVVTHDWSHAVNTAVLLVLNILSFAIVWAVKLVVFSRIFKSQPAAPKARFSKYENSFEE